LTKDDTPGVQDEKLVAMLYSQFETMRCKNRAASLSSMLSQESGHQRISLLIQSGLGLIE
jgi:hypothetical protein